MKQVCSLLVCTFLIGALKAQVAFEPGYFIDNSGNKTSCLIRNADKNNNPTKVEYKLSETGQVQSAPIGSVKEFAIDNSSHRYVRKRVKIERSTFDISTLNVGSALTFNEEELFLRVLVEGKASLYTYTDKSIPRKFFLQMNDSTIEQLVSGNYLTGDGRIARNEKYKQQLWLNLKCPATPDKKYPYTQYDEKGLVAVLTDYNKCVGHSVENFSPQQKKGARNFSIEAGLNTTALEIAQRVKPAIANGQGRNSYDYTVKFQQKIQPVFGFEMEYILPYYKNKWSVFIAPSLQLFKDEKAINVYNYVPSMENAASGNGQGALQVNYSHLAVPFGLRHYMFLKNDTKLFVNAALSYAFVFSPSKVYRLEGHNTVLERGQRFVNYFPTGVVGVGYKSKGKVSVEARYFVEKVMLTTKTWKAEFTNSISLIGRYRIK